MSKKEQTILEKAARLYAIPHYMRDVDVNFLDEYPYDPVAENAFIAGAEWQKERDTRDMIMSDGSYFQKCYELGKKDAEKKINKELIKAMEKVHEIRDVDYDIHVDYSANGSFNRLNIIQNEK